MPRVSKPGAFGLGDGSGKLRAAPIGSRQVRASPAAFGAGRSVESYGGGLGPEAFGGGRNLESFGGNVAPEAYGTGQPLISAETENRALGAYLSVQRRDEITQANADSLKARSEYWLGFDQRQTARAEGDPGEFTKDELAHYDEWQAKQLDGATGFRRQVLEQDMGQLRLSVQNQASNFEGTRRRQYREEQQKVVYDQTLEQVGSARNAAFSQPSDLGALQGQQARVIDASGLPDDLKAKLHRTTNGALADAAWLGRVEKDPYGVKAAMERGDPRELQGLEFDDRTKILGRADSTINGIEVEKRRAAAEARAEANRRHAEAAQEQGFRLADMQDQVAAVADAAAKGLPVEGAGDLMKKITQEAHGAMSPSALTRAQRMAEHLNLAVNTSGYARDFAKMPIDQQMAEVDMLRTTPHSAEHLPEATARYEVASKVLKANQEAVASDKVLERANEVGLVKLAPVDPADPASIAKRVNDARTTGAFMGVPADKVKILTPAEADDIVGKFGKAATADERLALLAPLTVGMGDDATAQRVLDQLEAKRLPADARLALERLHEGDVNNARELLGGLGTDPKDLPKLGDAKAGEIDDAVNSAMGDPEQPAGLTTHLANLSRQPGMFSRAAGERDAIKRLATQYVAAGADATTAVEKAAVVVHGDVKVAGSSDLGYVRVPGGADADAVSAGMATLRGNLDVSHMFPAAPLRPGQTGTGAEEGARIAMQRDLQAAQQAVRSGGIWTDAGDGNYSIMLPTGRFLPDPADPRRPKVWSLGELSAAGKLGAEAGGSSGGFLDSLFGRPAQ